MHSHGTFLLGVMHATCRLMRTLAYRHSATNSASVIPRECRSISIAGILWPGWRFDFRKVLQGRRGLQNLPAANKAIKRRLVAKIKARRVFARLPAEAES